MSVSILPACRQQPLHPSVRPSSTYIPIYRQADRQAASQSVRGLERKKKVKYESSPVCAGACPGYSIRTSYILKCGMCAQLNNSITRVASAGPSLTNCALPAGHARPLTLFKGSKNIEGSRLASLKRAGPGLGGLFERSRAGWTRGGGGAFQQRSRSRLSDGLAGWLDGRLAMEMKGTGRDAVEW